MAMTKQLLDNGFKETISETLGRTFDYRNNWMGISKYHPEAIFVKDKTKVYFRLCTNGYRFIKVVKDDKTVYENYRGVEPDASIWQ